MLDVSSSIQCLAWLIIAAHDVAKDLSSQGKAVISGFQSPAEKELLAVLSCETNPSIACLGRGLDGMRILVAWWQINEKGQLLIISAFPA